MTLGELIKEYRSIQKISMDDFAQKSGISKATRFGATKISGSSKTIGRQETR